MSNDCRVCGQPLDSAPRCFTSIDNRPSEPCHTLDPIQAAQAAVVEKARVWAHEVAESVGRLSKAEANLLTALSSLDALQPKGLRPEEVKPGTRFRFLSRWTGRPDGETYIMAQRSKSRLRFCVDARHFYERHFDAEDRIIPEPQE